MLVDASPPLRIEKTLFFIQHPKETLFGKIDDSFDSYKRTILKMASSGRMSAVKGGTGSIPTPANNLGGDSSAGGANRRV